MYAWLCCIIGVPNADGTRTDAFLEENSGYLSNGVLSNLHCRSKSSLNLLHVDVRSELLPQLTSRSTKHPRSANQSSGAAPGWQTIINQLLVPGETMRTETVVRVRALHRYATGRYDSKASSNLPPIRGLIMKREGDNDAAELSLMPISQTKFWRVTPTCLLCSDLSLSMIGKHAVSLHNYLSTSSPVNGPRSFTPRVGQRIRKITVGCGTGEHWKKESCDS